MRGLRLLIADRPALLGFVLSYLLLVGLLVLLLVLSDLNAETTPLHYNIYFGIDLAGPGRAALWPWFVALVATIANTVIAAASAERDRLTGRLLAWFSLAVIVLTWVASLLVLTYRP